MIEQAQDAEATFLASLDQATPQARAEYIDSSCAGDAELLRRMSRLILRWIEGRLVAEVALLLRLSEKQVTHRQQQLLRNLRDARALYRGEPFAVSRDGSRQAGPSGKASGVVK
jgi:hypothetical protein